ncbi:MAG: hypothetical protein HY903_07795 [Deltaproteobacteria bacterium]|nr:hypothetical protein [Deltaproteobacteria bacterium]
MTRGKETPGGLTASVLWGAAAVFGVAGVASCSSEDALEVCGEGLECSSGWACVAGDCRQICRLDDDCGAADQVCQGSLCVTRDDAECRASSDCVQPGRCEVAAGALCRAGRCAYGPRPCTAPPAALCSSVDTYRTYAAIGGCDPWTDTCVYTATDTPCTGCAYKCLGNPPPECRADGDCDDHQSCTQDLCADNSCRHVPRTGAACDDGNVCTLDACAASGTCAGTPMTPTGSWSIDASWSACSMACGGGIQTRTRTCVSDLPASCGAATCSGSATETQTCNTDPCENLLLDDLYVAILWRKADAVGVAGYALTIRANGKPGMKTVAGYLLASSEFEQLRGAKTASQVLNQFYLGLLHRPIDSSGRSTFTPHIEDGEYQLIIDALIDSTEFNSVHPYLGGG